MVKKKESRYVIPVGRIEKAIYLIRGQKVILDRDLASIYGIPTYRFNEAVKRNRERFPEDFMFQLKHEEVEILISQNAMSKAGQKRIDGKVMVHGLSLKKAMKKQNNVQCQGQTPLPAGVGMNRSMCYMHP